MKQLLLFTLFFASTCLMAQPFAVGEMQMTFNDASRNRTIDVDIYYPATTAGTGTPVESGQFPVLVFGHGFLMGTGVYDVVWNELVPEGYIMVLPQTESGLTPSHEDFGKDIAFLVDQMQLEGQNGSSPFNGAVATTSAAMGHSMGGGSAFLSVQYSTNINAIATLAAAETNPSAEAAAANISIPSLIISGANDCVTPPADHQLLMQNALISNCKSYVSITGGSHCQFASFSLPCSTGELTCSAGISDVQQQELTASILLPWLDFYLKSDCAAGDDFQNLLSTGTGITSQQNCSLSCLNVNEKEERTVQLYPNPAKDMVTISGIGVDDIVTLLTADGRIVSENLNAAVDTRELSPGTYFVRIQNDESGIQVLPLIIQR